MGNIVFVQQIRTVWSKASRGGENARKRNGVPEAARVPLHYITGNCITGNNLVLVHHRLSFGESNGFARPYEKIIVNPALHPLAIGCVTVDHGAEAVVVTFQYNRSCGGAPDRHWARKTLCLAPNEWGQVVYNGRFTPAYDGDWWYEKTVVNVGLYERPTRGMFTKRRPNYSFHAMGELY